MLVQVLLPNYPYPSSADLIPDNVFVAADKVDLQVRKAVAAALYR